MNALENVLIKPLMTEKTSITTDKTNRYSFIVRRDANKNQIRQAVEKYFDVKVERITTAVLPGKLKRSGKSIKKTPSYKKAYVKVQEGQKIEFFKGI